MGLVQVVVRHLSSYIELGAQAAAEYRAALLRRAIYAAAALIAAVATVVGAWVTGLALVWDTPWRNTYCVASVLVCLAAAGLFIWLTVRRPTPGPHVRTLRREAEQDLALLQEWRSAQ